MINLHVESIHISDRSARQKFENNPYGIKRGGLPRLSCSVHVDQKEQGKGAKNNANYLLSRHRIVRHEWSVIWIPGPSEDTRRKKKIKNWSIAQ
jgi:hypothetical protein